MSDILTIREDLAQSIRDTVGEALNVYSYPAESIALPAAVIVPADPWWQPATFGQQPSINSAVQVSLDVQLIVPRTEVEEAMIALEQFGIGIGVAIATAPVLRWVAMSSPDPITVGEIDALKVVIETTGKI